MSDYILAPYYSLRPGAITLYELPEPFQVSGHSHLGFKNLASNVNKYGELSAHATKRLRKTIDYMIYLTSQKTLTGTRIISKSNIDTIELEKGQKYTQSVNYKLTFITLTLPSKQIHSDNEIKSRCLNHFLTDLKRKYQVDLYIWKAEKQENGNIHFHILTNKYIKWQSIRTDWNRIINKLGYVTKYSENMKAFFAAGFRLSENPKDKRPEASQYKSYLEGLSTNFSNPNSTDIHALYKIKNVAAYISKYLAKEVTKTDRIIKIDSIKHQLTTINQDYDRISLERNQFLTFSPEYKDLSDKLHAIDSQEFELQKQLNELKTQGVEGRIWGCSSALSQCSNFSELAPTWQIPDFEIIAQKKTGEYINDLGTRKIVTLTFNMDDTPQLNKILHQHLVNSISKNQKFKLQPT